MQHFTNKSRSWRKAVFYSSGMETISRDTICMDAERYSQQHSWYKLPADFGAVYYLQFMIGEQARNGADAEVSNTPGLHLWFVRACGLYKKERARLPAASFAYPVILTRNFCGFPGVPEHPAEVERQKIIKSIVENACALAEATGIRVA